MSTVHPQYSYGPSNPPSGSGPCSTVISSTAVNPPKVSTSTVSVFPSLSSQVRGEDGNLREGAKFGNPPSSEPFSLLLHPSNEDRHIEKDVNVSKVPNLLLLGPKTLNLKSWIDYKTDCFNVEFPRSIMKSGMNYLNSDCHDDGDTLRVTESKQHVVEEGNEIWYDLAFRNNLRTGQLKKTSILDEYHALDTGNVAGTVPNKVALSNSGVQTVDKLLSMVFSRYKAQHHLLLTIL